MPESEVSRAAKTLSARGASKGGKARAKKLTAEERREIAKTAAEARWGSDLPVASYGGPDRPLRITGLVDQEDIDIPCYVLDDGSRVLVQAGMLSGMNMSSGTAGRGAGDRLVRFTATKSINPFVRRGLTDVLTNPIKFRVPSGAIAYGYQATVLADLCDAVLEARKHGKLNHQQEHIAERCEILVRGFARVGIIALVDEATGFQDERAKDALAAIFEAYISKELSRWVKTFPDEYYHELFRLRGVHPGKFSVKRPQYIGHLTNNIVYKRLAPGVLRELKKLTPKTPKGNRRHRFHQRLTVDAGHPKLREHLAGVITLMRASTDWGSFKKMLDKALPKYKEMPLFDHLEEK